MLFVCTFQVTIGHFFTPAKGTRWRLKLSIGREPTTSLPASWAASGGRLLVAVDVDFTDELLATGGAATFVARRLAVVNGPSRFVSERGQEEVTFGDGGWCLQPPNGPAGAEPGAGQELTGYESLVLLPFKRVYSDRVGCARLAPSALQPSIVDGHHGDCVCT
jgi:hypothetical protein